MRYIIRYIASTYGPDWTWANNIVRKRKLHFQFGISQTNKRKIDK